MSLLERVGDGRGERTGNWSTGNWSTGVCGLGFVGWGLLWRKERFLVVENLLMFGWSVGSRSGKCIGDM